MADYEFSSLREELRHRYPEWEGSAPMSIDGVPVDLGDEDDDDYDVPEYEW